MADANVLNGVTNEALWNMAREADPTFASHTAQATANTFSERGFEALQASDIKALNEYVGISMRVAFQKLDFPKARNPVRDSGLLQVYDTPNGGYIQRVALDTISPVNPAFAQKQEDGDVISPFAYKDYKTMERFFGMNYDFQATMVIKPYELKTVFLSEYGMGQWISGKMQALSNAYTVQEYENVLECLNNLLTSTKYPLQRSQVVTIPNWNKGETKEELNSLVATLKTLRNYMESAPMTNLYNAGKYMSAVDTSDMVLLVRPELMANMDVYSLAGAFHEDRLVLPFEVKNIQNFGGLVPYTDEDHKTRLYPAYGKLGDVIGYNTVENSNTATVAKGQEYNFDPNSNIIGILCQKGLIFEDNQNPYRVEPIHNPRTLIDHYWASRPNCGINGDYYYNMVVITKPSQA